MSNINEENDYIWSDKKRNSFGLPWTFTKYFLKENKLIVKSGFLTTKFNEIELYKITDKEISINLFGKIFNYGSITLYSRDTNNSLFVIKNIKNPQNTASIIENYIDKQRDKYNIRGRDMYGGNYFAKNNKII